MQNKEKALRKLSASDKKMVRKAIRESGKKLLQILKEELLVCELTRNLDRVNRLLSVIHHHTAYEVMQSLQDAGLEKEITALADKAGQILKNKKGKSEG